MYRPSAKECAVILNQNAKKVSDRLRHSAEEIAPRIALYTSRTKEEAYQYVKEILDNGYRRIISGGGDGTLFHLISMAKRYLEEKNVQFQRMEQSVKKGLSTYSLPEFGVLKLGTGNSLATLSGVGNGLMPLKSLAHGMDFGTFSVNLIEAEQRCFTFSGMGWDAAILNDYLWLKNKTVPLLSRFIQSLGGYLTAMFIRTIPSVVLRRKKVEVVVTNEGDCAYKVTPDGERIPLSQKPGDVLYDGPCNVAAVATTPFYGYHLKAFPFAMTLPGYMQVRIVKAGVAELLANAHPIWRGTYRSPNFIDFLAERVRFSFSERMPLQIGGDPEGYRHEITFSVSDLSVDLIDFRNPLPPPLYSQDTPLS